MLLISAMMLGTTTYAWFSMNNSVYAEGMKVTARNTSGSLLIGTWTTDQGVQSPPTKESIRAAHTTHVDFGNTVHQVMPVQHSNPSNPSSYIEFFSSPSSWSYKIADNAESYASTTSATTLTSTTFEGYVVVFDLWICIESGSNTMNNLTANVTIDTDNGSQIMHATRVVVASESASEEFYNAHTEGTVATNAHTTGVTVLRTSITTADLVPVKVYIYIDGEDADVYTNNALNLANTGVRVDFLATPAS